MINCPTTTCVSNYDSDCVIYHADNITPSRLPNLNIPNNTNISCILERIDSLLGNNFSLVLDKEDTNSIAITLNGPVIEANVKVSANSGNTVQIVSDGLYIPSSDHKIKVSSTDTNPDYAINKFVGDTDGIVSISVTQVTGGVLKIKPTLNIQALLTAIENSPALLAYFKNM